MASVLDGFAALLATGRSVAPETLALHLLDTLGAWHAGTRTEDGELIAQLAAPASGAAVFAKNPLDTIARQVASIRNTEIDDIHMESCVTPSAVVVPVALTLAATLTQPSAAAFARGLAAGYEAMKRLSLAVSGASILYRGIWPSFFTAPVGAAAAAAPLLGLDEARTADALAIALTFASGAAGGHGEASPRWLLLGQAARCGVFAALAAAKSYRGDHSLLDGDWLQRTHGIACDGAALAGPPADAGIGSGLSYKPFCAAKQVTAAIDGFRQLLAEVRPERIAAVRIAVPPAYAGMIGHRNAAKGRVERITGAAYQLALAAYRPDLLEDVVRPDLTSDPAIAAFMPRVEVRPDPDLASYFPRLYPARVEATLDDGTTRTALVTEALGDPDRSLDQKAVEAKFHRLADPVIGRRAATKLATAARGAVSDDAALATLAAAVARSRALNPKG